MDTGKASRPNKKLIILLVVLIVLSLGASVLINGQAGKESIKEVMRDAVLHENSKMEFFAGLLVNPSVISAYMVTTILLVSALLIRLLAIPNFQMIPGSFQLALESLVGYFYNLAKKHSPKHHYVLGAYVFSAGLYVGLSTLFELLGIQYVNSNGLSASLPAPIADINAAISLGLLSYGFILVGGLVNRGVGGVAKALKDFSLPISMSFRLFGALLSGLLVNELVYYSLSLSFVLPVVVAVLFTLIHALVQAYVLTLLTAIFYGEASALEEPVQKHKQEKQRKNSKKIKLHKLAEQTDSPAA